MNDISALKDDDLMTFGKWKGYKMKECTAQYLDWLSAQPWLADKYPEVGGYILANRKLIDKELDEKGLIPCRCR